MSSAAVTRLPGRLSGSGRPVVIPVSTLVLVAALAGNCIISVAWPDPMASFATLVLYVIAIAQLFSSSPSAVMLAAPFMVMHFSVMLSLIAIESGAYMKEMGAFGHASISSATYIVYSLLLLCSAILVYRAMDARRVRNCKKQKQAEAPAVQAVRAYRHWIESYGAVVIGGLIVSYLLLRGLGTGFPLLTGTDRFQYRSRTDVLTLNFLNLKYVLGALIGCGAAFATTPRMRKLHHWTFVGYILASFLFGDKFFNIMLASIFYSMPFLIREPDRMKASIRRGAPMVLIMLVCVSAVTVFIYSGNGALTVAETVQRLGDRVAGQGQLWFMAVEDGASWVKFDEHIVRENFLNLFANPASGYAFEHRLAAFYFVERYSPPAMHLSFVHNAGSVTPTMVFEAYGLVTFGFIGLAFTGILLGAITGLAGYFLARSIMTGNPINTLLPAFVMTQMIYMAAQGTMYSLIGLSSFKAYAAFWVLQRLVKFWIKRQPPRVAQRSRHVAAA
jgi:hypothetical protein